MSRSRDSEPDTSMADRATGAASLAHADWTRAADEEYRRLLSLLRGLDQAQWSSPTDCDGWDVRALTAHLAGGAQWSASVREFVRQARRARRLLPDADVVDGMNAVQVAARTDRTPDQLLAELAEVAPKAVRARHRLPRPLRALRVPFGSPLGTQPLGYLYDRILTRDTWLHRVDIARAVDRPLELTAEHDGRIVADVVDEWAELHGQPFTLELTGPAGGRWRRGHGGEQIRLDAVEFCRILSGRAPGTGLLATRVNF